MKLYLPSPVICNDFEIEMLYRPNFCCNCGEKIERVEWNLLTSRRFCVVCSSENRRHDVLPRLAVTAGTLALMFGIGSLWSGSGMAESKPLQNAVGIKPSSAPSRPAQNVEEPVVDPRSKLSTDPEVYETGSSEARAGAALTERSAEKYFCGALTKKGTPCSRKVKVKGVRCFQHEGRPEAARPE